MLLKNVINKEYLYMKKLIEKKKQTTTMGLEPTISRSGGERLIH